MACANPMLPFDKLSQLNIMLDWVLAEVGAINSDGLLEQFEEYLLSSALASATVVNYLADLRAFLRWCELTRGAGRSTVLRLHVPAQGHSKNLHF